MSTEDNLVRFIAAGLFIFLGIVIMFFPSGKLYNICYFLAWFYCAIFLTYSVLLMVGLMILEDSSLPVDGYHAYARNWKANISLTVIYSIGALLFAGGEKFILAFLFSTAMVMLTAYYYVIKMKFEKGDL